MPGGMSRGPVIVAMTRRPEAMRCATAAWAPCRLSTSTKLACEPSRRPAHHHDREAGCREPGRERVVLVQADEEGSVHVARGQVLHGASLLGGRLGHQQDQLAVAGRERRADAAQQAREERVREHLAGGLRDDHRDRVAAPRHEAPGGPVGGVAELLDGGLDPEPDVRAHARRVVHDARDGRPGDARELGDLLQRCVAGPGTTGGLWHVPLRRSVRALSRLWMHSTAACQESALTACGANSDMAVAASRNLRPGVRWRARRAARTPGHCV